MASADGVIRVIGATIAVLVIIFVGGVGYQLVDPIYHNVIDESTMESLGWGTPQFTTIRFMGLGLVGLLLATMVWLWVAPIREDVRQDQRPRGPF